jgi:GxxExxY protein
MKHQEITYKIVGAAMEVHKILGCGFQELIYQRALEIELASVGLTFQREFEMDIFYKGERIGGRRVDFFVENCIMVELKALTSLEDVHMAQAMNYLEAYNVEIGLLINFGAKSLLHKRLHNKQLNNYLNHDSKDCLNHDSLDFLDAHDSNDFKNPNNLINPLNQGSDK